MDSIQQSYILALQSDDIQKVENFIDLVKNDYLSQIVLPENKKKLKYYLDVAKQYLFSLKVKNLNSQISTISSELQNIPIGDNIDTLESLKRQVLDILNTIAKL
jgi:hypothetical protein